MKLKNKLSRYVESKKSQLQHGREVSEQLKAEKQRNKMKRRQGYEPGSFRYGLAMKQSTRDFMRDVYEKRKRKREEKMERD